MDTDFGDAFCLPLTIKNCAIENCVRGTLGVRLQGPRERLEDDWGVAHRESGKIFRAVVCDGLGGEQDGDVAARLAAQAYIEGGRAVVCAPGFAQQFPRESATTLTGCEVREDGAIEIAHVGDSSLWTWDPGAIPVRRTPGHTVWHAACRFPNPEQGPFAYPGSQALPKQKHRLLLCLPYNQPRIFNLPPQPSGRWVFLMSDGFLDGCDNEQGVTRRDHLGALFAQLAEAVTPSGQKGALDTLRAIAAAQAAVTQDNATLLGFQVP